MLINWCKNITVLLVLLGLSAGVVKAQYSDPAIVADLVKTYPDIEPGLLKNAMPVLKQDFMKNYNAYGAGVKEGKASSKFVESDRFETVIQVETHDVFYNDWDVEIGSKSVFPILQNDCVYLTFWIRCLGSRDESNQGFTRVYLQQNGPPWLKSSDVNVVAGSDWVQYRIPFHAKFQNYGVDEAAVAFAMGYSHQTLEVADVRITNLGANVTSDELPGTTFTYEGREEDAEWRKAAADRIEKYRKGDVTVVVKDGSGKTLTGAEVKVDMAKHSFGFGNIVSRVAFSNPGPDGKKYRQVVKENFNQVTMENALKYNLWQLSKSEGQIENHVMKPLDSLKAYGIDIRGHVLVWPSVRYTAMDDYIGDAAKLSKVILDHITEVTTAVKGRLVDWDVMNEPYVNHQFMDILGKESVATWFREARKNEPDADLYINETRFLVDQGVNKNVQDNLHDWVTYLTGEGVKIDGLGFQGHFGETGLTSPDKLLQIYDRFAKLDVKMKITELDISTDDDELQADYLRDFYTVSFSHPNLEGIISWGFWEKAHWRPSCAWYRKDWSIKPVGLAHQDLVYKEWWTNEKGTTDGAGTFKTRGFCGDYVVTVTANGKTVTQKATVVNEGSTVEVVLK